MLSLIQMMSCGPGSAEHKIAGRAAAPFLKGSVAANHPRNRGGQQDLQRHELFSLQQCFWTGRCASIMGSHLPDISNTCCTEYVIDRYVNPPKSLTRGKLRRLCALLAGRRARRVQHLTV